MAISYKFIDQGNVLIFHIRHDALVKTEQPLGRTALQLSI